MYEIMPSHSFCSFKTHQEHFLLGLLGKFRQAVTFEKIEASLYSFIILERPLNHTGHHLWQRTARYEIDSFTLSIHPFI